MKPKLHALVASGLFSVPALFARNVIVSHQGRVTASGSSTLRAGTLSSHNGDHEEFLAARDYRSMGESLRLSVAELADELDARCGFVAFDGSESELRIAETSGARSHMITHEPILVIDGTRGTGLWNAQLARRSQSR